MEFYKEAFGTTEKGRMDRADGTVMRAEIQIGDSRVMPADECPQMNARGPQSLGGTPGSLHLYVQDADAVTQRAVVAGAKVVRAIQDQFYGDRSAMLADPFGHLWNVSTHKEGLSVDEIKKRAAALFKQSK